MSYLLSRQTPPGIGDRGLRNFFPLQCLTINDERRPAMRRVWGLLNEIVGRETSPPRGFYHFVFFFVTLLSRRI